MDSLSVVNKFEEWAIADLLFGRSCFRLQVNIKALCFPALETTPIPFFIKKKQFQNQPIEFQRMIVGSKRVARNFEAIVYVQGGLDKY